MMDRESIAELFSVFGPVSVKRMFSGFGVYAEDVCFGLFLRGEFYFKTDETTIPRFQAEASKPFSYTQPTSGKVVTVNSFWRLPERLYDDQDELAEWARAALGVAQRLKVVKRTRTSRTATDKPTKVLKIRHAANKAVVTKKNRAKKSVVVRTLRRTGAATKRAKR